MKIRCEVKKHLMAAVTYFSLVPLVYFIPPEVGKMTTSQIENIFVSVGIIVLLMSYLIIPFFNRLMVSKENCQ